MWETVCVQLTLLSLPVIISRLLSSRCEETTSPMFPGEPNRSCHGVVLQSELGLWWSVSDGKVLLCPAERRTALSPALPCGGARRRTEAKQRGEVNTGLVHSGRTHPLGVITGPTCSVGPAKGVARTRSYSNNKAHWIITMDFLYRMNFMIHPMRQGSWNKAILITRLILTW